MPVNLFVRKASDTAAPDLYTFDEEVITIGRDGANVLTLPDPNRVISKRHAEIQCREDGAYLVDLGSKNFTYLNGERLESGRPRVLHSGDLIQVGDFELRFEPVVALDDDRTVFDAAFVNPFEEDAQRLVEAFNRICQTFEGEPPARRADALRDAMQGFIVESEPQEARALLASLLGLEGAPPYDPDATLAPQHPPTPARAPEPARPPEPARLPTPSPAPPPSSASPAVTGAPASRQAQVLQVLLDAVARLIAMPAQFRYEFIGQTIMHAPEASFLYEQSGEVLARHLLDPGLPEEEARERLALLKEALEDLAAHQVAMLEGYKAAVRDGAERLIDYLDPDRLVEDTEEEKGLRRFLPAIVRQDAYEQIQERCRELRASDWSVSEQRFYRPAFIRAYLAREVASSSR